MSERLFTLLRQERERLEIAIAKAEAQKVPQAEVKHLKALHRIVGEQICSWMRDLYGDDYGVHGGDKPGQWSAGTLLSAAE